MSRILIAESGASKTEWRLLDHSGVMLAVRSVGFNPNVMTASHILTEMMAVARGALKEAHPDRICFYGAGIGGPSQEAIMQKVLSDCWPGAALTVTHDLSAAVHSTLRSEGIVCIIGTGSNSCLHRNHEVVDRKGGHGYLFGDEGSGMDLGRRLVMGLLQGELNPAIQTFVESQEGLSVYELKLSILKDPQPNVRLARLAKHLDELIQHEAIRQLIVSRFLAFLDTTVLKYPGAESLPVDVFGSIGWHFQALFREAMTRRGLMMGNFVQDPIEGLVQYHLEREAGK